MTRVNSDLLIAVDPVTREPLRAFLGMREFRRWYDGRPIELFKLIYQRGSQNPWREERVDLPDSPEPHP